VQPEAHTDARSCLWDRGAGVASAGEGSLPCLPAGAGYPPLSRAIMRVRRVPTHGRIATKAAEDRWQLPVRYPAHNRASGGEGSGP